MTNRVRGCCVDLLAACRPGRSARHSSRPRGRTGSSPRLVVGDEDRRDADPRLDLLQLEAHLVAPPGIEIGERLVEQQHVGVATSARPSATRCCWPPERSGAGRSCRPSSPRLCSIVMTLSRISAGGRRLRAEREGDVLEHVHVRPDGVGLEHHAHPPLVGRQVDTPARPRSPAGRRRAPRRRRASRGRRSCAASSSCRSRSARAGSRSIRPRPRSRRRRRRAPCRRPSRARPPGCPSRALPSSDRF